MHYSKPVFVLPALVLISILSANDTAAPKRPEMFDYFSSGVTTGYESNNLLLCDPELNGRPLQLSLSGKYIHDECSKQDPHQPYHLIPVPDTFATRYIRDMPGDTVMVLWSGGTFKAVIDDIVYYMAVCYSEFVCVLKPVTEIENRPKRFDDFITLRKEKFYDGPIFPYTEYRVDDSSYLAIIDSVTREMVRTRVVDDSIGYEQNLARMPEKWKEELISKHKEHASDPNYPFYEVRFYLYGRESNEIPDTLYLFVVGATGGESSWVGQWELSRSGGVWKTRTMSEPDLGSYSNIIQFAFDLNGDGVLEYFINNSIYILFNGVFALARAGSYRGC